MSETQSPIGRLVLFIVCIAFAGTFVAGVHYFAIDLPQQNAVQAPENWDNDCEFECSVHHMECDTQCPTYVGRTKCKNQCTAEYNTCMNTC